MASYRQVEHGFRGAHADAQVADLLDGVGVFPGMLLVGVYPWPRVAAHLLHGLGEDATGDAGVDGGLDELRYGAGGGGAVEGAVHRDDVLDRHPHVVQDDGAAGGGALAEAGPVVDHRQPRRVARDERQVRALLGVEADDRYPVGEQGAARIELAVRRCGTRRHPPALVSGIRRRYGCGVRRRRCRSARRLAPGRRRSVSAPRCRPGANGRAPPSGSAATAPGTGLPRRWSSVLRPGSGSRPRRRRRRAVR